MESKKIGKKLISGSLLRVIQLACSIGVSFYLMPFIIHAVGDRWYGFWTLVGSFLGYYSFLDLGLSSAVSRYVSRAYGQNDYTEMNIFINTALALFIALGCVAFAISCLTVFLCPFFINSYEETIVFQKIIIILGSSLAVGFPMRVFNGVLTTKLRYDLIAYIRLFKLFIRTALIIYFIKIGYGILALAFITFAVDLLGYFFDIFLVIKEFPQIQFNRALIHKEKIKSLTNYGLITFISQIADYLRFKIDSFVIAGFLNMSLVTYYYIGARLIEYFCEFIISSVGIMSPVFSRYEGRNDFDSIRKWFLKITKISTTLSFFIGISLILYGKPFLVRWMGSEYISSYYIMVILCIPAIIALSQNPSIGLLYGISKHKYYAFANSGEGVLNLILSVVLVQYFGIYGVAMGTMIEMLLFKIFIQPIYTCHVINITISQYYLKTICYTAIKTTFPLIVYFFLIKNFLKPNYIAIFSFALIQVILFIPISFFLIFEAEDRKAVKDLMYLKFGNVKILKKIFSVYC